METLSTFSEIKETLAQRAGETPDHALEPLLAELWRLANDAELPPGEAAFASLEPIAIAALDAQESPSVLAAKVLRSGRALVEVVEGSERLAPDGVARLRALVDQAVIELLRTVEAGSAARRSAWLSYMTHEIKNPLNTLLNALWLLRERGADSAQASRFLDLAERAVRKLEDRVRGLRALDQQLGALPPGWEGRLAPKRQ